MVEQQPRSSDVSDSVVGDADVPKEESRDKLCWWLAIFVDGNNLI